jgi:flavin reductase (DIM6/NTAB) family NADH-FMN oxidoreductase RutF
MKEISGEVFVKENPITLFSQDNMVLVSQAGDKKNAMTVSWGELGYLFNYPVFSLFIKKERYTRKLLDRSTRCCLCRMEEEGHQYSAMFRKMSGYDRDKFKESGLNLLLDDGFPYFEKSNLVIFGEKIYVSKIRRHEFRDDQIQKSHYFSKSFYNIYIYKITKVLVSSQPKPILKQPL